MRTRKKRLLSILLCLCFVIALLPAPVSAAGTGKAIQLTGEGNITGGIAGYTAASGYDYVYFGTWNGNPVKWRVLDDETNTGAAGLFLLSDQLLGTGTYGGIMFDSTEPYTNVWQGSNAQSWCAAFGNSNLTPLELAAALPTSKNDAEFTSPNHPLSFSAVTGILNGDRVFFLSAEEAENTAYGFTEDAARIAYYNGHAGYWWLRSPSALNIKYVGYVFTGGQVQANTVNNPNRAARPAFNLDPNAVLFTSAAAGGKSAAGMDGGLAAVSDYSGNEWKLTLKDSGRNAFAVSAAAMMTDTVLTFRYSNAKTGDNEYLSAVVLDANGKIMHYGRILRLDGTANGANGEASINLSGIEIPAGGNLYVFNEQYNSQKTDYASELRPLTIAAVEGTLTISKTVTGLPADLLPASFTFSVMQGDDVIETVTVTKNANNAYDAQMVTLPTGEYTVVEGGADVDGYTLTASSDLEGGMVTVADGAEITITFTNEYAPASSILQYLLTLTKVDADDNSHGLADAMFDLYWTDGTTEKKVGSYTTDSRGVIHAMVYAIGSYYWVETQPPTGYTLDATRRYTATSVEEASIVVENKKTSTPPDLNGDDHFAYIIGYPDGLVHPEAQITRAEVATIFFRLLKEDVRSAYITRVNGFSDVNPGDWFNTAISTMAALGIVDGYPDGRFGPNDPITRAEFAAIAARFDSTSASATANFTDINGHWAEIEISKAAANGWVNGYPDNTFKPNRLMTRAEAMALINRVLNRNPETPADLLPGMIVWPDNMNTTRWYYLDVQEATNSHDYTRKTNNTERWTKLNETPDWSALED